MFAQVTIQRFAECPRLVELTLLLHADSFIGQFHLSTTSAFVTALYKYLMYMYMDAGLTYSYVYYCSRVDIVVVRFYVRFQCQV